MAKRRSREQIDADQIIKKHLNELGEKVYNQATDTSRRDTGRLQDEQNYRVQPDTVLTFGQMVYGQWNYPKGITSGEKNALLIAINDHLEDATGIIIQSITDEILKDFKQ
jgi:uncharacterized protein (DUF2164 family)